MHQAEGELAQRIASEHGDATCDVRLLGRNGSESYVWATCTGPSFGGVSAPMRVTDTELTMPRDGSLYADDIRAMFPSDLAELVLEDSMQVRP